MFYRHIGEQVQQHKTQHSIWSRDRRHKYHQTYSCPMHGIRFRIWLQMMNKSRQTSSYFMKGGKSYPLGKHVTKPLYKVI